MDFRRGGPRDGRRRRAILEESLSNGEATAAKSVRRKKRIAAYNQYALVDGQPRLSDLAPTSTVSLTLIILSLALLVVALLATERYYPKFVSLEETKSLENWLTVNGTSSVGRWFASTLFLLAAIYSVVIYGIRRHRLDDYRARYRVWGMATLAFTGMSLGTFVCASEIVHAIAIHFPSVRMGFDTATWSHSLLALVVGLVLVRLSVEMRRSIVSVALALLGGMLLLANTVIDLRPKLIPDQGISLLVWSATFLFGAFSLALSLMIYSRFVHFDAQGRYGSVVVKGKKSRKTKPRSSASTDGDDGTTEEERLSESENKSMRSSEKNVRVDQPHKQPASPSGPLGAAIAAARTNPSQQKPNQPLDPRKQKR